MFLPISYRVLEMNRCTPLEKLKELVTVDLTLQCYFVDKQFLIVTLFVETPKNKKNEEQSKIF